jgi:hypothetical protein
MRSRLVVVSLALALAALPLHRGAALDARWFERTFAVDLVTTAPEGEVAAGELGAIYVGEGAIRLEGSEDDVPFVLIYDFRPAEIELWVLELVGTTAMRFVFERGDVVEIDLLGIGALILAPDHPAHPCALWPAQAFCYAEGGDTVRGVAAERWLVELEDGFGYVESFTVWVGDGGRVLRTAYPDGYVVDFLAFREGPQLPTLFEVPEGFERIR